MPGSGRAVNHGPCSALCSHPLKTCSVISIPFPRMCIYLLHLILIDNYAFLGNPTTLQTGKRLPLNYREMEPCLFTLPFRHLLTASFLSIAPFEYIFSASMTFYLVLFFLLKFIALFFLSASQRASHINTSALPFHICCRSCYLISFRN